MWKQLFSFETMLTPKIIIVLYWISLAGVIIASATMLHYSILSALASLVIGVLSTRVGYELLIVIFKNNEYLKKIAEKE